MKTVNMMIVGVGGQGSLLASKVLGHLLLTQGYDVKVSEVHGMSQRGGSVVTYVRFGDKVYAPIVDKGEADLLYHLKNGSRPVAVSSEKRRPYCDKHPGNRAYASHHGCRCLSRSSH